MIENTKLSTDKSIMILVKASNPVLPPMNRNCKPQKIDAGMVMRPKTRLDTL